MKGIKCNLFHIINLLRCCHPLTDFVALLICWNISDLIVDVLFILFFSLGVAGSLSETS
jgi:hypothetical protein